MPIYTDQEKIDESDKSKWLKDNSQRLLAYNQLPNDDDNYDSDEGAGEDGPLPDDITSGQFKTLEYHTVAKAINEAIDPEVSFILYRGVSSNTAFNMHKNNSAGGEPANINTPPPTIENARQQVGKGAYLPEFSVDESVFDRFSRNRYGVVVKIKSKYLSPGSESESGFVANKNAPIEILKIYDRTFGKPEKSLPNAS
ncbi:MULTISPECIES: DUF4765 family protein [Photorhabdus]|uniref:DUF4765 domain-containing protein n=1 Tax=Photorhabdus hindustanensis TaxID=2918802 RepID=A0A2S8PXV6_9GAMM|nr:MULTISPECIES: DUF4765 family protein [Photorhabdus]MCC8458566.1 DUF4765 family protein [Photorhabdus aegyptia]PQQ23925.1 DUF4765 domain-containing protein [Photorhabdus hindustanensis]